MFTKREIREIAEDLVEDLREAPDGYCITSAQLLRQNGYDLKEFGEKGLFYFHQALDRVAKANHIDMDMSAHDGKLEGLLYNLDFIVRNEQAQIECPYCGSRNTARIFYGMPSMNLQLMEKIENGKVCIGGCCIKRQTMTGESGVLL